MKVSLKKSPRVEPAVTVETLSADAGVRVNVGASVKITRKQPGDMFVSTETQLGFSATFAPGDVEKKRAELVRRVQEDVLNDLAALIGKVDKEME